MPTTLTPGTRLGPYEIVALIGAGGMGEVYRARDTKLRREVAIKVLLPAVANDPERLARFQREAHVLAALNHPHIAAIYGLEDADGPAAGGPPVRALVLELVEGPTLADRIARGPIPLDDALPIARQIAEALEAAHEQGIIHRDLKPANIKVRADGTVKVLDFGLAKALDDRGGRLPPDLSASSTMTSPALMTGVGVLLGTAAYMSPEQARGKSVDRRTDIWAFGAVLFEMLTGQRAFAGDEVSATIAAVLRDQPDWTTLPASTPAAIRTLLRRCLEKDPKRRVRDAGDARLEIDETLSAPPAEPSSAQTGTAAPSSARGARVAWLAFAVALLLAAALAVPTLRHLRETRLPTATYTTSMLVGVDQRVSPPGRMALSPDGRRLAYVGSDADGRPAIFVRSLRTLSAQALAGTEGANSPFWSPDSRFIAFSVGGRLRRIDAAGGSVVTIAEGAAAFPGAWSRDDVVVFTVTGEAGRALYQVPASGGSAKRLPFDADYHPFFLPDGRHFLFLSRRNVYIGSLDGTERSLLIEGAGNAMYAHGHVVFLRETSLYAQAFDPGTLKLAGDPFPLAERVQITTGSGAGAFSVSEEGSLVYQGIGAAPSQLIWLDGDGRQLGTVGAPGEYGDVQLSPDGSRVAVSLTPASASHSSIWLLDVARGLRTPLTSGPSEDAAPIWSPDGKRIAFNSRSGPLKGLYVKTADGATAMERLVEDRANKYPDSWSPNGQFLLFTRLGPSQSWDLSVVPVDNEQRAVGTFQQTPASESDGRFSSDGRWVAYRSNDSGQDEVYVAPYPWTGQRFQISSSGGISPRWRRDGKELYFVSGRALMAAPLAVTPSGMTVGTIRRLFEIRPPADRVEASGMTGVRAFYDVSADGQRFLMNMATGQDSTAPLTLVVNWLAAAREPQ